MEDELISVLGAYCGIQKATEGASAERKGVTTAQIQEADAWLRFHASHTPGFAVALLGVLERSDFPRALRQLAASALLNWVVKRHWSPMAVSNSASDDPADAVDGDGFTVPEDDKVQVRARLPALLQERDGKVRSLISSLLSTLLSEEWPTPWGESLPSLLALVTAPLQGGAGDVDVWLRCEGALAALEGFVSTVGIDLFPPLSSALLPSLFSLALMADGDASSTLAASAAALSHSDFGLDVRLQALTIVRLLLEGLGEAISSGEERAEQANEVLDRDFMPLLGTVASVLGEVGWGTRLCSLKIMALRILNRAVMLFASRLKPAVDFIFPPLNSLMIQTLQAFRAMELDDVETPASAAGTSRDGMIAGPLDAFAKDDDEATPALVCLQMVGLMQSILVTDKKFIMKRVRGMVVDWSWFLLSCCQLSETVLAEWGDDSSNFFRDEIEPLEAANLRQEVATTVKDLVDAFDYTAINSVLNACMVALSGQTGPSDMCVLSGQKWKVFEAAIYLVGCCRLYLVNPARIRLSPKKKKDPSNVLTFDISTFVDQLLSLLSGHGADAFTDTDPIEIKLVCAPYVVGRSLWCASCLANAESVSDEACQQLLAASIDGLQPDFTMPVRIMACKSLNRLVRRLGGEKLEPSAPVILERLTQLITSAIKVTSTVLDVDESAVQFIQLLVRTCAYASQAASNAQATITNLLLHLWCRKGSHPVMAPSLALGLESMIGLDDPAAASAAMATQLPIIVAYLRTAYAAADMSAGVVDVGKLPPILLPDGDSIAVADMDATVKGVPEFGAMSSMAMDLLDAMVRRTRELCLPAGPTQPQYMTPPPELAEAVALALQLLQITLDRKVMSSGLQLLTTTVRLCGPNLNTNTTGLSTSNIMNVAARMLISTEDVSDEAACGSAPLVTAILSHCSVPGFAAMVLPALATRLTTARLTTFVTRLTHAISHCLICDFDASVPVLMETSIVLPPSGYLSVQASASSAIEGAAMAAANLANPASQSALAIYLRAVSKYYELLSSPISRQVIMHAITRLLTVPAVLEHTACIPVAGVHEANTAKSHSSGPKTRSKTGGALLFQPVSLPVRMLTLAIKEWADAVTEEEEEAEESDSGDSENESEEEEGGIVGNDGEGEERGGKGKRHKSPFLDADRVEDVLDDDRAYRKKSKKRGSVSEEELMYLTDLLGGGDAMGSGKTIADLLAAGHHLGDNDDSGEDEEDGYDNGIEAEAENEDVAELSIWDEVGVPGEEGIKYAPIPHDAVVAHFVTIQEDGSVCTAPAVEELTSFIVLLAKASLSMPDSAAAALITETMSELAEEEKQLLVERVLPVAQAQSVQ
jgi:hypothetical protein